MQFELNRLLSKLTERLVRDSQEDMELKSELRALAACLLEVTKGGPPIRGTVITRTEPRESEVAPPAPRPREFSRDDSDVPSSTIGVRTPGRSSGSMPVTDEDLPMIETRCRLKRESLLWAIDRQGLLAKRADYQTEISPVDRELIRRAKELPDCYLWMLSSQWRPPENTRLLEDLAECFENMATATSLARRLLADESRDRIVFEQALDLLAEAQSAVRMVSRRSTTTGTSTRTPSSAGCAAWPLANTSSSSVTCGWTIQLTRLGGPICSPGLADWSPRALTVRNGTRSGLACL